MSKQSAECVYAISLLQDAIRHLERGDAAAAGWRVADAGELVAKAVNAKGDTRVQGVHGPTGLGNQIINIFNRLRQED